MRYFSTSLFKLVIIIITLCLPSMMTGLTEDIKNDPKIGTLKFKSYDECVNHCNITYYYDSAFKNARCIKISCSRYGPH